MKDDAWRSRIEAAVKQDGRSLRDISLAAGLSHGYLHGILRDDKEPTLDRFIRICQELKISVAFALLGLHISPDAQRIVKLLEDRPEARDAILALLPRE
jgi:transcriptional regulator with XRE-family HTH domain